MNSDEKLETGNRVTPTDSKGRIVLWLTLAAVSVITSCIFGVVYIMTDGSKSVVRPCHCSKMRAFKVMKPNIDHELWAYASLWSVGSLEGPRTDVMSKFAPPSVLDNLQKTFKRLSLNPTTRIPERCNNVPWQEYYDSFVIIEPKGVPVSSGRSVDPLDFTLMDVPPVDQLFSVDLKPEFEFNDDVIREAQKITKPFRESERFDMLIPIYWSGFSSDIEQKLPNKTSNWSLSQIDMLNSSMDNYRRTGNPLFLVLGNNSMLDFPFTSNDTVWVDTPDNVSLAVLSSSNDIIFDHGLWPIFGALLARSNVNSFAMDKNLLDAARNASLNWTATVTY